MHSGTSVRITNKPLTRKNKVSVKNPLKIVSEAALFQGRKERSVAEMYDQDDLSACCLFAGNFINFGFWGKPLKKGLLSVAQRIESEKDLYRYVIKKLNVTKASKLLEIACGQGVGSALAMKEFNPMEVHGVDFSKVQITRAKKINAEIIKKEPGKIFFQDGAAEKIPYKSNAFEKVFSIEAAQHFEDLEKFAKEANRVLKPGGRLAVASFFGTSHKSQEYLASMIQTIRDGIDKATPISEFEKILRCSGFEKIKIESVGKNVWPGFDKWTAQGDLKDSWTRNWYKGYQKGLIDYYLVTAEKPK
jgi:ubiquinone/menaquinone biosynthesis C-methylase UbiE